MSMVFRIVKYKYIVVICLVVGALSFVNYTPGTWLTGWDDSHPEFNFGLNISRAINGVWREHRGLGLVSGLAHPAQIFRYFFLWLMSIFFPASFLRYLWQFLMLLLGPLGVYFFAKEVLFKRLQKNKVETVSFLTSLFYLFNLATLQTFYVPLETFTTQYGFLPWLFFYIFRILENPSRKNIFIFTFINVVSASQAFTPTLFFAYLSFVFLVFISRALATKELLSLKNTLVVFLIIIVSNLYWLFPFGYFVANGNAGKISQATINVLSSEESFLMNKKFGNISDVALLKGFLFATTDFNQQTNSYEWLLDKWVIYQSQVIVKYMGYALFGFVAVGVVSILWRKCPFDKHIRLTLVLFFLASLFFLMGDNPPFGAVFSFFQKHIPFFGEALRFPFTKYSLLASFTYTCLFGVGLVAVADVFECYIKKPLLARLSSIALFIAVSVVMFLWVLPMFQGDLIYKRMRVKIPQEYFAMFSWFNEQKDQSRILKLPVQTYWSWGFNDWGYRGSGFTWYGIKQPTIDRAFDVWSPKNESVYREVSYAIYSNDVSLFKKVLEKYDIAYILVDNSVYEPNVSKTAKFIGMDTINTFLSSEQGFTHIKDFGFIGIYKYERPLRQGKNISSTATQVDWLPKDVVYINEGPYLSGSVQTQILYPFMAVGNYNELKAGYSVGSNKDTYTLGLNLGKAGTLQVPNYFEKEKAVFAKLFVREGRLVVSIALPRVLLNGKEISHSKVPEYVVIAPLVAGKSYLLSIDDNVYGPFSLGSNGEEFGTVFLDLSRSYEVSLWDAGSPKRTDLLPLYRDAEVDSCINQDFGSYELEKIGNVVKLSSVNNIACIAATRGELDTLGLFSLDFRGDFDNASISYCVYGDTGCLNDRDYQNDFLLLEKSLKPFTVQFYSSPVDTQRTATSLFKGIDLVQYQLISSNKINFSDFLAPFSDKAVTPSVSAGDNLTIEVPKPNGYNKAYIYENFDKADLESITHECNFNEAVKVDSDFKKILSFVKKELQVDTVNKSSCFTISNKYLGHNIGYFIEVPFKHLSGKNQKICLQNSFTERCDLIYKLGETIGGVYQETHFLVPSYNDGGAGYKLTIENTSTGTEKALNVYDDIGVYPFPYDFANGIKISSSSAVMVASTVTVNSFNRITSFLYSINSLDSKDHSTVVLNQAYDKGWVVYCGFKPCKAEHVLVNNWANGWLFDSIIDTGIKKITIIFWPQILEYLGFIALTYWFFYLLRRRN